MGDVLPMPPCKKDSEVVRKLYSKSMDDISRVQDELANAGVNLADLISSKIEQVASDLDGYDYLFACVFGILGAVISTNDRVQSFCTQIHRHASGSDKGKSSPIQATLGNILHHQKDQIDMIDGNFTDRAGNMLGPAFHRLLWGHDPFSLGADNPFVLLSRQYGIIGGVTQVFRHLVADTFSRQGLPIPGHSLFDSTSASGKTSNHLHRLSMELSSGQPAEARQYFDHLFTLHAQDVAAQGFVWATAKAYAFARNIEDATRIRQYRIVSYAVNFFTHAGIGAIRQGGVPYISWPALTALIKEVAGLFIDSYKEIARLQQITNKIVDENRQLEQQVFATGASLVTYRSSKEYTNELVRQDSSFMRLVDFFEEG